MKRIRQSLILLFAILAISACSNPKSGAIDVNPEFGNLPAALIDSLKTMGAPMQAFAIDATKDNVISGKNGTTMYVPANSLLDASGKPVSGEVTLELKEHFSMADYVTSNLQTVHDGDILQTQGMVYFSAKDAAGGKLAIDQNKPIRLEIPIKETDPDAKIFLGQRDADGRMNWTKFEEPNKLLIPFPIRELEKSYGATECPSDFGFLREDDPRWSDPQWLNLFSDYYRKGDISSYENTLLATREFLERFHAGYCDPKATEPYATNLEKDLWEIDELMVDYFIADSIERVDSDIKFKPRSFDGGPPSKEQLISHKNSIEETKQDCHRKVQEFRDFAAQKLTKIDESRKVPADIIAQANAKVAVRDSAQAAINSAFIAYNALEFGWVNVDVFFNDPDCVPVQLFAETNRSAMVELILPGRKVVLSGTSTDGKRYRFTQTTEGYNKLPKGEKAILLSLQAADGKLYFAQKEIVLGQNETEKLDLVATSAVEVKQQLSKIGS